MRRAHATPTIGGRLLISASLGDCVDRTRFSRETPASFTNLAYEAISLGHPNPALQTVWFLAVSFQALVDGKISRGRAGVPLPTALLYADQAFHMLNNWPENFVFGLERLFMSRLEQSNYEAERVLRFVRDRIYQLTLGYDPLNMCRIFQQQTRDLLKRANRSGSLRSLSSQLELELEPISL